MDPRPTSRRGQVPRSEPLELRRLLSSAGAPAAADSDDVDTDKEDVQADLPGAVADALREGFPGAEFIEAERHDVSGGDAYEVSVRSDGRELDLLFASDGELLAGGDDDLADDDASAADATTTESAAPVTPVASAPAAADVEVVEMSPAEAEADDDDADVSLAQLPPAVREAFAALYPGANVIGAEFGPGGVHGEGEFDVRGTLGGGADAVEVTLAPDGQMIEAKRVLAAGEVPPTVREWVRQHFAGGEVAEAALLNAQGGQPSYELLIAPAGGGQDVEAVVRVAELDGPGQAPRTPPPAIDVPVTKTAATAGSRLGGIALENVAGRARGVDGAGLASAAPAQVTAATARPAPVAPQREASRVRDDVAGIAAEEAGLTEAQSSVDAVVARRLLRTLPRAVARVTRALPPFDAAGFERRVDAILSRLDALATRLGIRPSTGRASRLAVVVALVAASHLYRLRPRAARTTDSVGFVPGRPAPSWSWVLGRPSPVSRGPGSAGMSE
jgi:hypothetical protein